MTRVLAALLLAQFAPTLATHGRRRLHLISAADVSSVASSTTTTSAAFAFDLLPSTHWRSDAAAPYLSATLASSAWSLTSYGLSTYGLHGADAAVAPTAWSLSCVNVSGVAAVVDARSGETLATDELLHTFALGAPAAGCAELRLDFPSATALSDVYLFAAWAAEDACADADGFKDAFGHTCAEYAAAPHWCVTADHAAAYSARARSALRAATCSKRPRGVSIASEFMAAATAGISSARSPHVSVRPPSDVGPCASCAPTAARMSLSVS